MLVVAWSLITFIFFIGIYLLAGNFYFQFKLLSSREPKARGLAMVTACLEEFQETLQVGLNPSEETWKKLQQLADPWKELAHSSLSDLRKVGATLIPTLRRLRSLIELHRLSLQNAQAKSAQAFAQAFFCSALIPILGSFVSILVPEVNREFQKWLLACILSMALASVGTYWMIRLSNSAQWGGLRKSKRDWPLWLQVAIERLLALVRTGHPPDYAWSQVVLWLSVKEAKLALLISQPLKSNKKLQSLGAEDLMRELSLNVQNCIQSSQREGSPCLNRIELSLQTFQCSFQALVERELNLLASRSLKPLFLCVAPALLGLLAAAFLLVLNSSNG